MGKVKNFPPYEEAKKRVIEKGIKSPDEYKAKYKELGLPSTPSKTYKDKGWIDYPSFWGKEIIIYPSYEDAKKIVIEKGIKSWEEYMTKYKELGLPSAPNITYKDKGWIDYPSFWGKETIIYPSYEDAKKIVREKGIETHKEYKTRYKELGLPSSPQRTYKDKGWIDWDDFLGKETIIYPSYDGAKKIVIEKGINSGMEYRTKYKELGLPSSPEGFYKGKGWIDWNHFLGKETKVYPSYENAKGIVIENGIKGKEEYEAKYKELGLPSNPNNFYKEEWIDWADFLGKPHKTSHKERREKVLSKLALNPILLGDKAPLQIIYMLATNMDKELASEIEILLKMMSCEDRLNWVKKQLKTLKVDAPTTSDTSSETIGDEIPAMESMLDVFEDSMDELPDEDITNIKVILENYYHNVINKELIEEYDD